MFQHLSYGLLARSIPARGNPFVACWIPPCSGGLDPWRASVLLCMQVRYEAVGSFEYLSALPVRGTSTRYPLQGSLCVRWVCPPPPNPAPRGLLARGVLLPIVSHASHRLGLELFMHGGIIFQKGSFAALATFPPIPAHPPSSPQAVLEGCLRGVPPRIRWRESGLCQPGALLARMARMFKTLRQDGPQPPMTKLSLLTTTGERNRGASKGRLPRCVAQKLAKSAGNMLTCFFEGHKLAPGLLLAGKDRSNLTRSRDRP